MSFMILLILVAVVGVALLAGFGGRGTAHRHGRQPDSGKFDETDPAGMNSMYMFSNPGMLHGSSEPNSTPEGDGSCGDTGDGGCQCDCSDSGFGGDAGGSSDAGGCDSGGSCGCD